MYSGQSMGQKAKTFTDNVLGRIVGVNPFGGNFPQTINIDGAANKYTGAGIAALIYGMLPIRALPHKGKAKSLGKKIAVAGILGGIFDAPEGDSRNRVVAQRPSIVPRLITNGRQVSTI